MATFRLHAWAGSTHQALAAQGLSTLLAYGGTVPALETHDALVLLDQTETIAVEILDDDHSRSSGSAASRFPGGWLFTEARSVLGSSEETVLQVAGTGVHGILDENRRALGYLAGRSVVPLSIEPGHYLALAVASLERVRESMVRRPLRIVWRTAWGRRTGRWHESGRLDRRRDIEAVVAQLSGGRFPTE